MPAYLAFLRAVNVGGTGKLPMAELRTWLTHLGLADVRTVLQSGNALFRAGSTSPEKLEQRLTAAAAKDLGLKTTFFVRTVPAWSQVIARNPFPSEATTDPAHLVVLLLKNAPAAAQVKALQAAISGREQVRAHGRQAYVFYPDGIGESKLTLAMIEKRLGTRCTGRNWNTVQKMAALAASAE